MTKVLVLLGLTGCVFAAGSAAADFGANDDTGKFLGASSAAYFAEMADVGLERNVMTLKWDPELPEEIPDRVLLDAALPLAEAAGIEIVFALYGARPTTFTGDGGTPHAFADWVATVARAYPEVRRFVIGNEPNQPRFWRPQFSAAGAQVSAAAFGPVLAAAYDALEDVDPDIEVIGLGLSPRGNDNPRARSNVSTSPVRFLKALGDWYRRSGRTKPLMDHLSFHPYPQSSRDGIATGYRWPNIGIADLGRIQQSLWDAFAGTAQPTTANGLKLHLDEVGWQVETTWVDGYEGIENVVVTDEGTQADIYAALVRRLACEPAVASMNLFGFVDDPNRAGFQAGVVRLDGTRRPAADAMREALERTGGGCLGALRSWRVMSRVIGAEVDFASVSRPGRARGGERSFTATAREDAVVTAGIFRAGTRSPQIGRSLALGRATFAVRTGRVRAYRPTAISFPARALAPGRYVYGIRLAAWANPRRTTVIVSRPFRVAR